MSMPTESGDAEDAGWVATRVGPTGYRTEIHVRSHVLIADEPVAVGGTDAGPTPYEYLLAAMSGCMAMTLRVYADRKKWPLAGVEVRLRTDQSHESDCDNCATAAVGMTTIERKIELYGTLTDEQRQRLLQIADRCPVKQTMERGISFKRVS